jgi:protein arginine kinase activator
MLCDQCKSKEAVMRYTVVKDGRSEEHHLCADCASEKGLAGQLGAAISSLSYLLDDMAKEVAAQGDGTSDPSCPKCGLKLSQFRQTGRLGCGGCYQAFAPLLRRMIRQVHGSGRHLGKPRARASRAGAVPQRENAETLRGELAEAVRREEFELAASLRDRIRRLEAGGDGPAA